MKKVFTILGVVFVILVIIVGGIVGYAAYTGNQLDKSSKAYVNTAIPAIIGNWSEQALIVRMVPKLKQSTPQAKLVKLFTLFRRLGKLKKYDGAKGDSNIFISPEHGKRITAHYVARASFEHGDASIKILLIMDKNKAWKIEGFHVDSPAFLP